MRDLYSVAADCKRELSAINIKYGNVLDFRINTRAKHRWGRCTTVSGGYVIEISNQLLQENVPLASLKNTIIHELLHTCPGCLNHGEKWKRLTSQVNNTYNYGIKRTSSAAEKKESQKKKSAII